MTEFECSRGNFEVNLVKNIFIVPVDNKDGKMKESRNVMIITNLYLKLLWSAFTLYYEMTKFPVFFDESSVVVVVNSHHSTPSAIKQVFFGYPTFGHLHLVGRSQTISGDETIAVFIFYKPTIFYIVFLVIYNQSSGT